MTAVRSQSVFGRAGRGFSAWFALLSAWSWPLAATAQDQAPPEKTVAHQSAPRLPMLVHDRHVSLRVTDPRRAASAVVELAHDLDGELSQQSEQLVVVRIPAARLEEALSRLHRIGAVASTRANARDATEESAKLVSQLRSLQATRERLLRLQRGASTVGDALLVERQLAEVTREIARLEAARVAQERKVARLTLTVTIRPLETVSPETVPEVRLPFPWLGQLSLSHLLDTHRAPPAPARQIEANLDLALQLEGLILEGRPRPDETQYAVTGAIRSRGVVDTEPLGWAMGLDLALGGGQGFVYDLDLLLGLGASLGEYSSLGLLGGVGVDGWTGHRIPSSLTLPVELFATAELAEAARVIVFAQPRWAPTSKTRRDGSTNAGLANELSLGGAVLLAPAVGNDDIEDGGLRVGFVYRELLDVRMIMLTVGVGWGLVQY